MKLLRNLGRRKVRTALTILGITIGIWALVVFGSMANKINALVAGGSEYYQGKVVVSAKGGTMGLGGPLAISTADQVAHLPGVDVVVPDVVMLMSDDTSGMSMGMPQMITAAIAGADKGRETFPLHYASGRALTAQDEGSNVAVLGSDLARQYGKAVGDTITLRGETFTVVGILEPTLTAPDGAGVVPLAAAQRLYLTTLPPLVAGEAHPLGDRDGADGLPRRRAPIPRTVADRDQGRDPRRHHHDRGGLRQADRRGDLDPQLDPRRHRASSAWSSAASRSSTRWPCRSPSAPARSASSAPSAAAGRASSASS